MLLFFFFSFFLQGLKNIIKLQDILRKLVNYIIKAKHLKTLGIIILTSSANSLIGIYCAFFKAIQWLSMSPNFLK